MDGPRCMLARFGSPTMITALLEGVNAAQWQNADPGGCRKGNLKAWFPELMEGGHTNGIYNLIEGIKKVSSLNPEDTKNALLNDIREHLQKSARYRW